MIKFSYLLLFVFVLRSVQCDDVKPIKKGKLAIVIMISFLIAPYTPIGVSQCE